MFRDVERAGKPSGLGPLEVSKGLDRCPKARGRDSKAQGQGARFYVELNEAELPGSRG